MKKIILSTLLIVGCSMAATAQKENTLSKKEKKEGWILMFDGKTSAGWRGYCKPAFPAGWEIVDGAIHCISKAKGGDIIYDRKFKDFELYIEWKIGKGGNSGIMYRGQEIPGTALHYSAPEIQVIDNARITDAQSNPHAAGALYDMLPAVPQNTKPAGEWNTFTLRVKDQTVTHIQNGKKVCEYTIGTPEWREMCAKSKFKDYKPFVDIASEGYIGLQDHGDDVWYRSIKIKEL